jgi:hypothetical protein
MLCFVKSRANVILMIVYACDVSICSNMLNHALMIMCFDMRFESDFMSFDDIN